MIINSGNFRIMSLESKIYNSKITFAMENKQIKCKIEVKLTFSNHSNNRLRALTRLWKFLLTEEKNIYLKLILCQRLRMFCYNLQTTKYNNINKIHKRTLHFFYKLKGANFEDLLLKDNMWNIHENNIYTLLIEICRWW